MLNPNFLNPNIHFTPYPRGHTVEEGVPLLGVQLGQGAREQGAEDGAEVLVHLLPRDLQRLSLLFVQLGDHLRTGRRAQGLREIMETC